jgi:hypothetical protein
MSIEHLSIFELRSEDKDIVLRPCDLNYFKSHFNGVPMADGWVPPPVEIGCHSKPVRDFVGWMLTAPVVSERAKSVLERKLGPSVEWLPLLKLKKQSLYAVNVLRVIDCLDIERTNVGYASNNSHEIVWMSQFHFFADKIPGDTWIFKVPQWGSVFVTRSFVEELVHHELSGSLLLNPAANAFSPIVENSKDIWIPVPT